GRGLRPRLRAERGARGQGRGGGVERLRLRRHQRHPGVQADLMPAPSLAEQGRVGGGCPSPMIARTVPAGFDLLDLHRLEPARYPVMLESSATGAHGRRDMLLAHDGTGFALHRDGVVRDLDGAPIDGRFLDVLDAHWRTLRIVRDAGAPVFTGGWALLLSYELAQQVETILRLPQAEGDMPVAVALRCR